MVEAFLCVYTVNLHSLQITMQHCVLFITSSVGTSNMLHPQISCLVFFCDESSKGEKVVITDCFNVMCE